MPPPLSATLSPLPRGRDLWYITPERRSTNNEVAHDPVLDRFRAAVAETYGERLERVVLFGSRARGDFRPDSDYDVAMFLRDMDGVWDEVRRLADITTGILIDTGAVISAKPFRANSYYGTQPLLGEIRRDGRDL